jgi:NAD(P)-dependent dehydrogenase (short-subunit alcohol dehydrogenase family)
MSWTAADIPDQSGRHVVVTGANSGLGWCTTLELARAGARVTMGVRDAAKGAAALARIDAALASVPGRGPVEVRALDLADLASVAAFAEGLGEEPVDVVVNNAGVMAIPRRTTVDGFEMQLGTNHLGHQALTLRLVPALVRAGRAGGDARVVTVSSNAHRFGRMAFDDLMGERRYSPWPAYGQSKLANLLFAFELQRRLASAALPVSSYAAHPGYAATELQGVAPRMRGSGLGERFAELGNRLLAQPAEMGALPQLYAATAPGLVPGSYVGPDGFLEQRGHPKTTTAAGAAYDPTAATRLWEASEALVGLRWADVLASVG